MRVLVVEPAKFMLSVFAEALQQRGHEVVKAVKVRSLQPLIIETAEGSEEQLEGSFQVALVDGMLSETCSGPKIVEALSAQGTACLGISCWPFENRKLREVGALSAADKPFALSTLYFGAVTLEELRSTKPGANCLSFKFKQIGKELKKDSKKMAELSTALRAACKALH
jgi:CheY-like chemotaxis protein